MLRSRVSSLVSGSVVVFLLGGCQAPTSEGQTGKSPDAAGVASAVIVIPPAKDGVLQAGAADKVITASGIPIVVLAAAGAEPRSELRYALGKGASQRLRMTIDLTRSLTKPGRPSSEVKLPVVTALLDLTPSDQSPAGEWKVDAKISSITFEDKAPPEDEQATAEELRAESGDISGLGMSYWMSPKGYVHDMKLEVPRRTSPEDRRALQDIVEAFTSTVIRFPAEPVGVGAKWQVESRSAISGMDVLEVATYTLQSRDGSKVAVDVSIEQLSVNAILEKPGMPEGYQATVKSFKSIEAGASTLDVTSVAPESGSLSSTTAVTLGEQGTGADPNDEIRVETKTGVTLTKL